MKNIVSPSAALVTKLAQRLTRGITGFGLIAAALLLPAASADIAYKHGAVMARAVVLNQETGQPVLVEYDNQGNEVGEVSIPAEFSNSINRLQILSAAEYRSHQQRLADYQEARKNDLALGAELKSRDAFLNGTYPTADNSKNVPVPSLDASVQSVYYRGQSNRLTDDSSQLVLLTFPVDLSQNYLVRSNTKTLVLTEQGKVIAQSANNIAYRVGFYGNAADAQAPRETTARNNDDTIFGPVPNVRVSVSEFAYPGGVTSTGADGKYQLSYFLPPCPVGGFEFTTDVYAELRYQNFRPTGSPTIPYFLRRADWNYCFADLVKLHPLQPPVYVPQPPAVNPYPVDLWVDVMFLTGLVQLQNPDGSPVAITDTTEYHAFGEGPASTTQNRYDFNGDGKTDTAVKGRIEDTQDADGNTVKQFVADDTAAGNLQGIYFEAADVADNPPDLIRALDTQTRIDKPTGYLKTISRDDYQNTDILVFRESTGQLVVERIGLRDEEIDGSDSAKYFDETQKFFYRVMLRGPLDFNSNIGGGINRTGSFAEFSSKARMSEPFRSRDADHLKPGEKVRIVAINRATGYIGTARVQLSGAADNPASLLNVPVDDIVMRPPNLKVWAERDYSVEQGLTQGEQRNYLVGGEGAALTSDTKIAIYSEWLDHDGSPLPEGLGTDNGEQYGYTGRLAKIVSANLLAGAGIGQSNLANFPIPPGRQLQVLRLRDNQVVPEHFYIHISGTPQDDGPSFVTGSASAPYNNRPGKLTPFLAPLYDENSDLEANNLYRELTRNFDSATEGTVAPTKPLPAYAWQYRPEYQFSQYELEVQAINRQQQNSDGSTDTDNIIDLRNPVITSSDDLIQAMYSLISNQYERLEPIDGPQELILALGEEETRVTIGEDQSISFDNLDHLASLEPEDFLTMRLYTNQDAGNVLWEYAFQLANLFAIRDEDEPVDDDGTLVVSADEVEQEIRAELVGYEFRSPDNKPPLRAIWSLEGGGTLEKTVDPVVNNTTAFFANKLILPTLAGSRVKVTARLHPVESSGTSQDIETELDFRVVPGIPASVEVVSEGQMYVAGHGELEIELTVKDAHGNMVEDGTAVNLNIAGSLQLSGDDPGDSGAVTPELATVGGKVNLTVRGTDYAEQANISFTAGNVTESLDVEVLPYQIEIAGLPGQLLQDSRSNVSVTVKDSENNPVPGLELDLATTFGRLVDTKVVTNASGEATTRYIAPNAQGTANFSAVAGFQVEKQSLTIVPPPPPTGPGEARIESYFTKLIGDRTADGTVTYNRYDGTPVNVAYQTSAFVNLLGAPGETVQLKLGDLYNPNRHMLAAYWMDSGVNDIASDEVGFSPGELFNVQRQKGGPDDAGYNFTFDPTQKDAEGKDIPSRMSVENANRYKLEGDLSFSVALKLQNHGGTVVNLGNGLKLTSQADGRLTLQAQGNDAGGVPLMATVSSAPVALDQWYKIAARVSEQELLLSIDGTEYRQPFNATLTYQAIEQTAYVIDEGVLKPERDAAGEAIITPQDLIVGDALAGQIASLKWYAWRSEPLVRFENGQEVTDVTISATSTQSVVVNSAGKMQSFGGALSQQRIAVSGGGDNQSIVLVSLDFFERLTRFAVDAEFIDGAPPINQLAIENGSAYSLPGLQSVAASSMQTVGNFLVSPAHAYEIGFWDVVGIVGSLIGLDSVGVIWDQLGNMVAGREVDIVSFSVAVLDLLTLFPPAAPLKVLVTPAKLAIRVLRLGNSKATRYLGGVIKKMYNKALDKDFSLVFQGIAMFIILADMYEDEEAREGLKVLASTINSTDDLLSWMEYLSLADPELLEETAANLAIPQEQQIASNPLSWIISSAHAAPKAEVGKLLGRALKDLAPVIAKADAPAQSLGKVAKVIRGNPAAVKQITPYVFDRSMLRAAVKVVGKGSLQKLRGYLVNYNGRRIPPLTMILVVSYLEQQVDAGLLFPEGEGEPIFDGENEPVGGTPNYNNSREQLRILYAKAAPALVAKSKQAGATVNIAHGASFHLLELAKQQLLANTGGPAVIGIEVPRSIRVFNTTEALRDTDVSGSRKIKRIIDIMTGTWATDENWIEVKSIRSKKGSKQPLRNIDQTRWVFKSTGRNTNNTKGSPHRQFITDRIAKSQGAKYATNTDAEKYGQSVQLKDKPYLTVSSIRWQYHKFTAGVNKDIVNPDIKILRDLLKRNPKNSGNGGEKAFSLQTKNQTKDTAATYIRLASIQTFLTLFARNNTSDILDSAKEELDQQLRGS